MSAKKNNYKAKWLAALSESQQTPGQVADTHEKNLSTVENVQITTGLELSSLQSSLVEVATTARSICEVMDESRDLAMVKFKPTFHGIDGKLGTMPAKVLARRVRDVLRLAEERIGILSVICEEQFDAINSMYHKGTTLEISHRRTRQAVLSTLVLGSSPSPGDLEEYLEKGTRRNSLGQYDDLSDEFSSLLTTNRAPIASEGSDDDSDSDRVIATTRSGNNQLSTARQVQRGPVRTHKKADSKVSDIDL